VLDSCPLPGCWLARAKRCRTLREVSAKGACAAKDAEAWGGHGSMGISVSGVLTSKTAPAAPMDARAAVLDGLDGLPGFLLGDKGALRPSVPTALMGYQPIAVPFAIEQGRSAQRAR
jgi:hypothetical protein